MSVRLAGTDRPTGFAVVTAVYLVAAVAAAAVVGALPGSALPGSGPLAVTFWADLVATVVVFGGSMLFGNSSIYDPYWSVAPAVIAVAWVGWRGDAVAARQSLVVGLLLIWAVRLTANWAASWRGLGHEDWRYVQIREQTAGRLPWWLVTFTGIHLMPTLVVFAGLLAVWPAITVDGRSFGPLDVFAALVTATAIGVEAVADWQLRRFTREPGNRGRIVDIGLWRFSRHPNYLGEIGFWWGMWLFALAAAPSWWWTVVGPVAMVLLFTFVSVPLMDRRSLARRPAYAEHMQRIPALLPTRWK
ncbi:DUF1295 domain-containing protein [Paractinoplanes rishiriensis]|nr:DUF1295 domain-containing protein [Actinoplanes rishiriensis]